MVGGGSYTEYHNLKDFAQVRFILSMVINIMLSMATPCYYYYYYYDYDYDY